MRTIASLITVLMGLSISAPAYAQDQPQDSIWEGYTFRLTIENTAAPKPEQAHKFSGEAIAVTQDNVRGAQFICLNKAFRVSVATKPMNIRKRTRKSRANGKRLFADYSLDDGERKPLGTWYYENNTKIMRSNRRSSAAKIYNAAIRRQKLTLFVEGRKPFTVELPPPNKAFSEFGAECGIGIKAKNNP